RDAPRDPPRTHGPTAGLAEESLGPVPLPDFLPQPRRTTRAREQERGTLLTARSANSRLYSAISLLSAVPAMAPQQLRRATSPQPGASLLPRRRGLLPGY
ncbi:hypothetical protein P7K49_032417, partial [Saguinus oedipus]